MRRAFQKILDRNTGVEETIKGIRHSAGRKKHVYVIKDGINGVPTQLKGLRSNTERAEGCATTFEYQLGMAASRRPEEAGPNLRNWAPLSRKLGRCTPRIFRIEVEHVEGATTIMDQQYT